MRKIKLKFFSVRASTQPDIFTLVLADARTQSYKLPISIGTFEALMIAVVTESMSMERPSIYDVVVRLFKIYQIRVKHVLIYDVEDNVFFAKIILLANKEEISIETTPSDAVNIALRCKANIYTYKSILEAAGISHEPSSIPEEIAQDARPLTINFKDKSERTTFTHFSDEELQEQLSAAVAEEKYELAANIRDELNRRKR